MNRVKKLVALLALAVLVVACGGEEPTPTSVPTVPPPVVVTEIPAPTEVPAEAPPPEAPAPTEEPAADPAGTDASIIGVTWQWEQFQEPSGVNSFEVLYPASYTLTLQPDGIAAIQADCNQVQLGYTLDGNSLTFAPAGPSTLAFCGEGSLDTVYLQQLSEVVSYVVEGGQLYLNLMADAGNMVFSQGGLGITPDQISLDTQGLPYSWHAVVVPETPYDQSQPPGPMGLPEHMEILFGVTDPADRQPTDPIMYIIPVNDYREMWNEAGNPWVSENIAGIEELSFVLPSPPPTSGMPALPPEAIGGGVNDLAVQVGRAVPQDVVNGTSATQTGYRFVGRWVQDANPVTNQGLRYIYQGFTNDGQYLVSFLYPVSTSALPDDVSGVPADQMDQFNSDPQAYIAAQAEQLNALAPSDWEPDLATLDALVASLQITDMPSAGIQDETWLWTGLQPGATSETLIPVADPSLYQAIYRSDGTIEITADCNSASLPYELTRSGMAGGMLAQPGPMTLAECGPDSRYNEFINYIMASQDYRVRAGGGTAELILPAGGGMMIMVDQETFSKGIGLPPPEAGEPIATVIAPAGVNVRTGPGSEYPILGIANFGQTAQVVGISEDGLFWVVYVPGAPNDQGWVSAEFVAVENAGNVPVIPAPPIAVQPTAPTPTTGPSAPTSTPATGAPSEITFEASQTTINAGETATLSWNVENVKAVYMYPVGGNYANYPVAGQGSSEVSPGITTTYELLVFNNDNTTSTERIEIAVSSGLTNSQWTLQSMSSPSTGTVSPIAGTQLTARFEANGDLSGSAGCNTYSGGFTAYDQVLIMNAPLTSGLTFCGSPEGIMDQEQLFLSLMQSAASFQISAGQLSIYDSGGNRILVFLAG